MNKTKIAVQKSGRLNQDSLKLLKDCGISIDNGIDQLKAQARNFPLEVLYLRNGDIPQYLRDGVVDIAIVGENLLIEKGKDNVISLLNIFENCSELSFDQLYNFRESIKLIFSSFQNNEKSGVIAKARDLIKKYFPGTIEFNSENLGIEVLESVLDKQFIMKKHNFMEIRKDTGLGLKEFIKNHINTNLRDEKIYFYIKTKNEIIYIYELERDKLINFFVQESKISQNEILKTFSQIINTDSEIKSFIKTLIRLKKIKGYFSELGYFYPYNHLKSKILNSFQESGELDLKKYSFLPPQLIDKLIKDISNTTNHKFLRSRDQKFFYSLKRFKIEINTKAAKQSIVDLKPHRTLLLDEDFIELIKNLPEGYLSHFRKGTQWLTNLGTLKIKEEIKNSKIVGFFDILKIFHRANILFVP